MSRWFMRITVLVSPTLLLLAPRPAPAAIAPEAREVVERYLTATGGRAAFEAESTLHVKGRLAANGMKGTYEAWWRVPGCEVTRVKLGPLRVDRGCRDSVAWETDLTARNVRMLDGKDLEDARVEAWFATEQWARADQGGGRVALGSMAFSASGDRQALVVTPPLGGPRTLWFNTKTGLLDRVHLERDNHSATEWLTDYRLRGGRKRPLASLGADPALARSGEGLTIDSVWANAALPPDLFDPPASRGAAVTWLGTPGRAEVPFRYGGRHVWVRASIDGAPPADFLLDTGCSISALDREYAASIGLKIEGQTVVQGIGTLAEAAFATLKRVRLAGANGQGVEARDLKVAVVDMGEDSGLSAWRKIAGLIGYDFISRFTTEIDYDRGVVTFHDPARFTYRGAGAPVPMGLAHGVPTVRLALGGSCEGVFLVDVGNSGHLLVHGSMARQCGLAALERKELKLYGAGIGGGAFPEWLGRLDSLRIGPYAWSAPLVGVSLHTQGSVGSQDYSGNIGNAVLERFKCTFDYANRRLYLEPGARYAERDHYTRLGAELVRYRDHVYVVGVVHDSPADEAGLEPMDQVRAIDGKPVLAYTPEELERVILNGPAGSVHVLTVERDLGDVRLEVTLRDIL